MSVFSQSSGALDPDRRQRTLVSRTGSKPVGNGSFVASGGRLNDDKLTEVEIEIGTTRVLASVVIVLTADASYPDLAGLIPAVSPVGTETSLTGVWVYVQGAGGTGGAGSVTGAITTSGGGGGSGSFASGMVAGYQNYAALSADFTFAGGQAIVAVTGTDTGATTTTLTTFAGQDGVGITGGAGGLLPTKTGDPLFLATKRSVGEDGSNGMMFGSGPGAAGTGGQSAGPPINPAPTRAATGITPGLGGGSAGGLNAATLIPGGVAGAALIVQYSFPNL